MMEKSANETIPFRMREGKKQKKAGQRNENIRYLFRKKEFIL